MKLKNLLKTLTLLASLTLTACSPVQRQKLNTHSIQFNQHLETRFQEKQQQLNNPEEIDFFTKHHYPIPELSDQLPEALAYESLEQQKRAQVFLGAIALEAGKRTLDNIPKAKKVKTIFNRTTRLEFYIEGPENPHQYLTPTLQEQKRKEQEEKQNSTRINLLPGFAFPYEFRTGTKLDLDEEHQLLGEFYTQLTNPKPFGYELQRIRFQGDTKSRLGISLQKRLNPLWYTEIKTRTQESELDFGKTSLSLIRESKKPRSKLSLEAGTDPELKGDFFELKYGILF